MYFVHFVFKNLLPDFSEIYLDTHTFSLKLPSLTMHEFHFTCTFPSAEHAFTASNALIEDSESESRALNKAVDGTNLTIHIQTHGVRELRQAVNGVLEQLHLIVRAMDAFS